VAWREMWGDEAPFAALALGLAALESEAPLAESWDQHAAPTVALEALSYRIFNLSESLRILRIRENAFRIDNRGMALRLAQLERELQDLEREFAEQGERQPASDARGLAAKIHRWLRGNGAGPSPR
jgi:hypothetical protein